MNKTVKQLIFAVSLPCFNLLLTNTLVSAKGTGLIFVSNEFPDLVIFDIRFI